MGQDQQIYFDHNATTRVAPEVVEAMLPLLRQSWGNPSSIYRFGQDVTRRLEEARARVAALLRAEPREVVFTSGGTESNNAAIHSALTAQAGRRHLVTTAVEHPSVLNYCAALRQRGYEVTILAVSAGGALNLRSLAAAIRPDTALVSVMYANNETGVLFPLEEISALCRRKGVLCHSDAVQAGGKLDLHADKLGVDYLSLSAHKLHGPKGVGMLYIRRRAPFHPLLIGGHQEGGRRGGTENVANIVGFGRAAELAMSRRPGERARVRRLRDRLEAGLLRAIPKTSRNGAPAPRLPNTTNLAFEGVEAEAVLLMLDQAGLCASAGSACTTGSPAPSHVLTAMNVSPARARGSLRFSLGFDNTDEEVDYALKCLPPIIEKLRGLLPGRKDSGGHESQR